jgi:hypothetical protein
LYNSSIGYATLKKVEGGREVYNSIFFSAKIEPKSSFFGGEGPGSVVIVEKYLITFFVVH